MRNISDIQNITIEDYNYDLPETNIAKYPLAERDQSKLLVYKNGEIQDQQFQDLHKMLPENSLLVFNNTKVIRARLFFRKSTGALIEIFVLDPVEPADYAQNFQQTEKCCWKCIVGNARKWKSGKLTLSVQINNKEIHLNATVNSQTEDGRIIEFSWDNSNFTFSEILEAAGNIPIPPYLNRESEASDLQRYQTVYSKIKGSVAAPTAGLHFTDSVFNNLKKANIKTAELTLHVGAGTFKPVKANEIGKHEMHTEHILVSKAFIQQLLEGNKSIIAVGTTSIRTLESLYYLGAQIIQNTNIDSVNLKVKQWEAYAIQKLYSKEEVLNAIISYLNKHNLDSLNASTQIIIAPGYKFKIVKGMITNFHQPKSTLLLLISAFLGSKWKEIYEHALQNNYRFLSYGDSNLYL